MKLAHGAWSFGVNATAAELETANAVMALLERIGAHSADVVARWMHVHGRHGVKGDTEQCLVARWLRQAIGDPLLRVGAYHVYGYRRAPEQRAPIEVWRVADPPATFTDLVRRFDDGAWPELTTPA